MKKKNNINFKLLTNNMLLKKINILLLIIFMCSSIFSVHSAGDILLLQYEFEEGSGSLALDTSGNGFVGVINGAVHSTNSAFDNYGLRFDGQNDYIDVSLPLGDITTTSINLWVYPESSTEKTLVEAQYSTTSLFRLYFQGGVSRMGYLDDSGVLRSFNISNSSLPINEYSHISFTFSSNTEKYEYYENGVLISNGTIPNGIKSFGGATSVRIGSDYALVDEYFGIMDAISVYNFFPSQEEITQLIQQNHIDIIIEEDVHTEINIEGIQEVDNIIQSYLPFQNAEITQSANMFINLNMLANCYFYADSIIQNRLYNDISYSFSHKLSVGNHTGLFYCYHDYNNTRYYERTSQFPFSVIPDSPSVINFVVSGSDYVVADKSLYVVTPCIKHLVQVSGITDGVDTKVNRDKEFYFQKVSETGVASFNLSSDTYEFCLVNGMVQYSDNDFTANYNVNKVNGVAQMGEFDVPSNVTQTYYIGTELLDIYDKTDPKAFNLTWASIMGGLVLTFFAIMLMLVGIFAKEPKVVMAGTIVLLSAFGVSFSGVVLGAIF